MLIYILLKTKDISIVTPNQQKAPQATTEEDTFNKNTILITKESKKTTKRSNKRTSIPPSHTITLSSSERNNKGDKSKQDLMRSFYKDINCREQKTIKKRERETTKEPLFLLLPKEPC
jgi:hypothetical protein